MEKIDILRKYINESKNIVVLTGAGVSTLSGIKDFRSNDGLSKISDIPVETLLSSNFFYSETESFYDFYKKFFDSSKIKPNIVHCYLKKLEDRGKLKGIVTQNIDGLHSKAGSKKVYEIHGTTFKNHCIKCNKKYNSSYVFSCKNIPKCSCGGIIKPDVVLYGEALPEKELNESIKLIRNADMLFVLGTSLLVYPAAGLVEYFNGKYFVIVNRDKTPYDKYANLVINDDLEKVFIELNNKKS